MQNSECIKEAAIFPTFDSWWIAWLESHGWFVTCGEAGFLLNLAICGIMLVAMGAVLLFSACWQAWRENRKYRMRRRRHNRARRFLA